MAWNDYPPHGLTPAEETLQDRAEAFWRKHLPGLSEDLVTRLAFSFGATNEAISTRHRHELCELAMDYLYSEGLVGPGKDGWIWDDGQMISIGLENPPVTILGLAS